MFATLIETKTAKTGSPVPTNRPERVVQVTVQGEGSVSAQAEVEVSNDGKAWFKTYDTKTISGDTIASDYWPPNAAGWAYMRARVLEVTGEKAIATVTLGMAG